MANKADKARQVTNRIPENSRSARGFGEPCPGVSCHFRCFYCWEMLFCKMRQDYLGSVIGFNYEKRFRGKSVDHREM